MNVRALVRRAFPYLVIAIIGFALAYVIVFVFILPSKIVPPEAAPYHPDSSQIIRPIDTGMQQPEQNSIVTPPPVGPSFTPSAAPVPVDVPNLVGMALPDARGVLNTLQLNTVVERDTSSFQPPNTILRQVPEAGAKVSEHGTVTITASYLPSEADSIRSLGAGDSATPPSAHQPLPPIKPEPDTQSAPPQQ